jgi:hypothetical protein
MEKLISRYSQTYFLLGKLELTLRRRLIETLSAYSLSKGYAEWHGVLDSKTAIDPRKPNVSLGSGGMFCHSETSQNFGCPVPGTHFLTYLFLSPSRHIKKLIIGCITH